MLVPPQQSLIHITFQRKGEHKTNMPSSKSMLLFMCFVFGSLMQSMKAQDPSKLTLDYYTKTCPHAQQIVRTEMECFVRAEPRNAAIMLRLHFHDCFVQGCDGSVLLDDTATLIGEKQAEQNVNSLKGFDLVDKIKEKLEAECPGVVTCADLLAIAARDAVELVGGPYWDVPVGRLDSKTASLDLANTDIPTAQQGLLTLISKFWAKGLSATDMVALVGSHTIGFARCANYRDRIYGDFEQTSKYNPSSETYLSKVKETCPLDGGDDNISAMDYATPAAFDNAFYEQLIKGEGLLNSDQEMWSSVVGSQTADLVNKYWADPGLFFKQFSDSMVKMGNITNPEGGEVRTNCRFVNT
ncbi:Peroxidase [Rhynchospora pubera]|uniref:Peroxidase n=2 Tax=Rhynchospora pubera TaxID=906938 RepID=A0AAV8CFZ6_9POAL|nr:Peroxidase [Rhynchospora pubera]